MTVYEEEEAMITGVKYQLDRVSTRQEINAIYKRARNWNCLHSFWAGACDHDRYAELNEIFKGLRKEALKKGNRFISGYKKAPVVIMTTETL